mgnify:FL=1
MKPLDFLLYVDEPYINSLYDLYYSNVIEVVEKQSNGNKKRNGLGIKLFKSFPVELNAEREVEADNIHISETKVSPSIENKITKILDLHFNNTPKILTDLLKSMQEIGIYYFQGTFELVTIESKNGKRLSKKVKNKNNAKGLVWKMKLIPYGESLFDVKMALSGDKILVNYHHLTEEIKLYKKFTFNILGKITKLDNRKFSIKPIVIFYL